MDVISALLILLVVGVAMWLIHQYVSPPAKTILLIICGVVLLLFVIQVLGFVDLRTVRLR